MVKRIILFLMVAIWLYVPQNHAYASTWGPTSPSEYREVQGVSQSNGRVLVYLQNNGGYNAGAVGCGSPTITNTKTLCMFGLTPDVTDTVAITLDVATSATALDTIVLRPGQDLTGYVKFPSLALNRLYISYTLESVYPSSNITQAKMWTGVVVKPTTFVSLVSRGDALNTEDLTITAEYSQVVTVNINYFSGATGVEVFTGTKVVDVKSFMDFSLTSSGEFTRITAAPSGWEYVVECAVQPVTFESVGPCGANNNVQKFKRKTRYMAYLPVGVR